MGLSAGKMIKAYSQLKIGMNKQEIIDMLGEPTGTRVRNGIETLTWKHSEFKGFLRGGNIVRTIVADFENGKLAGYDSDNMDKSKF